MIQARRLLLHQQRRFASGDGANGRFRFLLALLWLLFLGLDSDDRGDDVSGCDVLRRGYAYAFEICLFLLFAHDAPKMAQRRRTGCEARREHFSHSGMDGDGSLQARSDPRGETFEVG